MSNIQGASIAATGTISNNSASLLTLATACGYTIVSNQSGQTCYLRVNSITVSATVYDHVIANQGTLIISDITVKTVGVYVAATSAVRVVGWPS